MKYRIKDLNHIKQDNITAEVIEELELSKPTIYKLLKGVQSRDNITTDTTFSMVDYISVNASNLKYGYCIIEDKAKNYYIVREDNLVQVLEVEDYYDELGINNIIRTNDKTILVSNKQYSCKKVIIERNPADEADDVKALMICLLKRLGYNIDAIYAVAESIREKIEPKDLIEVVNSDTDKASEKEQKKIKKAIKKKDKEIK